MKKQYHEIRDPLHVFIRLDSDEKKVLNSRPFQRLRYIHQLALTYLVYPGATHRRFEHSLGVMELAGRVFKIVTSQENIHPEIRDTIFEIGTQREIDYWLRVVRMAALCHDIGHLPFSHAAEKELLPAGWNHERLTGEIIRSPEMKEIWTKMTPPLRTEDIEKVAIGPKKMAEIDNAVIFTTWESILSEIISGDAFGVDRMDYLLRDSYHAGVAYGNFDHFRLIDTIRILPRGEEEKGSKEPVLGVEEGGLQSAESLLLARYLMFSQIYFHHVRKIYDLHLQEFLKEYLEGGFFPVQTEKFLLLNDEEIIFEMLRAARDSTSRGHEPAARIVNRNHFRLLYQRNPTDSAKNPESARYIFEAAIKNFEKENLRLISLTPKGGDFNFPVLERDGRINSSMSKSEALGKIPVIVNDFIFVRPEIRDEAQIWLKENLKQIIILREENEDE